ncbi:MAG: PilZ domain-containing protein [Novosphingobium sp.]|nr:PilZ domain-containing protein [Novosphingobium sp.]
MLAILAEFEPDPPPHDSRRSPRRRLRLVADTWSHGNGARATICDLSSTGMLIESAMALAQDEVIEISLPQAGNILATVVWTRDGLAGCAFAQPLSRSVISASLLLAPYDRKLSEPIGEPPPKVASATAGTMAILVMLVLAVCVAGLLLAMIVSPSIG